jgi:hypothetical protein
MSNGKKGVPRLDARREKLGGAILDVDYCVMDGDRGFPPYATWTQMLTRCYSERYIKATPTYKDCVVCDEWKRYSNFEKWFKDTSNGYRDGYCLDKDIIVKGNKVYSPDTCCFVPNEINALFIKHDGKRGKYPIGVSAHNKKFCARINVFQKGSVWLGSFNTSEEAFVAYKQAKESYIKDMAQKYFNEDKITKRVYDALMRYEVEITD